MVDETATWSRTTVSGTTCDLRMSAKLKGKLIIFLLDLSYCMGLNDGQRKRWMQGNYALPDANAIMDVWSDYNR